MTSLVVWALVVDGASLIVTQSSLFEPLRAKAGDGYLGKLLACSLCFGFWVGVGLALLGLGPPGLPESWPPLLRAWAAGAAASTVAYGAQLGRQAIYSSG